METLTRALRDGPVFRLAEYASNQRYLLSHAEADRIRGQLTTELKRIPSGTVLVFDPRRIESRASCFARILGEPLRLIAPGRGRLAGRHIVLQGALGSNALDIALALEKESVVAVVREPDGPSLLGKVDRVLVETYAFLAKHDEVTSKVLRDAFDLSITTANGRIEKLYRLGLLHRLREETLGAGGRRFVYEPVR
jgi:DNA-binding transcriptional ArsR family regulator